MRVAEYRNGTLTLKAPLGPNKNIHGTAFGGSLFSLAALAGWGLLQLRLGTVDKPENAVLGQGRIAYHLPVRDEITVRCRLAAEDKFQSFVDDFKRTGKARLKLVSEIVTEEGVAATLSATYFAWRGAGQVG